MKKTFFLALAAVLAAGCVSGPGSVERERMHRAAMQLQSVREMVRTKQLPIIEFKFDSAELLPSSFPTLDRIAEILKEYAELKLIVEGHCDDVGSDEYNDKLSFERARAVKAYLVNKGVYPDYVKTYGYGKRRRLIEDTSSAGRAINRRVEFVLTTRNWKTVY